MTTEQPYQELVAEMQRQLAAQQRQIEELSIQREQQSRSALEQAIAEFETENSLPIANAALSGPCMHQNPDGSYCSHRREDHLPQAEGVRPRVWGHSYRDRPFSGGREAQPGKYAREAS